MLVLYHSTCKVIYLLEGWRGEFIASVSLDVLQRKCVLSQRLGEGALSEIAGDCTPADGGVVCCLR